MRDHLFIGSNGFVVSLQTLKTDEIAEEGLEMLAKNEDILKMVDQKVKKAI